MCRKLHKIDAEINENLSEILQNWVLEGSKILHNWVWEASGGHLGGVWGPSWPQEAPRPFKRARRQKWETSFGAQNGAKIDPRWAKLGSRRLLKRCFLENVNFHQTLRLPIPQRFLDPQDASQNAPRSPQDGSKTILKRSVFRIDFCLRFWSVWGSILTPFGCLFGSQNRSFWASIF